MMICKTIKSCILAIVLCGCVSCDKFLDKKSEMSVNVPETLNDLRLMLDDAQAINQSTPGLIEMGADDYVATHANLVRRSVFEQDVYLWKKELFFLPRDVNLHWMTAYNNILIGNLVRESLGRIKEGTRTQRNTLEGEALFNIAFAYYQLSQIYVGPFVPGAKNDGLGLVYRPSSDFNAPSYRISIAESYQLILDLLTKAVDLLPEAIDFKTRPYKQTAYALLARVYLSMESYALALEYADKALSYNDKLADYTIYPVNTKNPFTIMAEEIIYYAVCNVSTLIVSTRSYIPVELYDQYDDNDLRKGLFYVLNRQGKPVFKGSYSGYDGTTIFSGLAIDELYFIKAESQLRTGLRTEAIGTMNQLLSTRWKPECYLPFSSTDEEETLSFILAERRKGLIYRGLRWSDLRRLNRDPRFSKTLTRSFEDNELTASLPANDSRYVYPIPSTVIERTGITQN